MQSPQSPLSSPQTPPSTNDFSSFQVDQKRYENAIDGFYSTIPVLTDTIKDKQQLVSDNLNSLFTAILKKIDEVKEQTETIDQFEMLQVEEEHETSLHKGPHGGNDSSAQVDSCEDEGDSEEDGGSEDGGSEDDRRKAGEYKRKVVMEENKGEETEVHLSKKFNQLGLEIESCMKALSSSYKNLPKLKMYLQCLKASQSENEESKEEEKHEQIRDQEMQFDEQLEQEIIDVLEEN